MLKISISETRGQPRQVLEGKLVSPWTEELEGAWKSAGEQPDGRNLVVDLNNVTLIGPEGETMLFQLMRAGARFCGGDVLTKHVLRQLA